MTITPPPELVQQWLTEFYGATTHPGEAAVDLAARAAQWGADQELEACCALMDDWGMDGNDLMECRRPKPPSLKEQAIAVLEDANLDAVHYNTILRALEALPDD